MNRAKLKILSFVGFLISQDALENLENLLLLIKLGIASLKIWKCLLVWKSDLSMEDIVALLWEFMILKVEILSKILILQWLFVRLLNNYLWLRSAKKFNYWAHPKDFIKELILELIIIIHKFLISKLLVFIFLKIAKIMKLFWHKKMIILK